ncbi:hypothetical protein QE436_002018 [Pantoea anthophila]|nr:hypothetical protein [Pantoea anthophila]
MSVIMNKRAEEETSARHRCYGFLIGFPDQ